MSGAAGKLFDRLVCWITGKCLHTRQPDLIVTDSVVYVGKDWDTARYSHTNCHCTRCGEHWPK